MCHALRLIPGTANTEQNKPTLPPIPISIELSNLGALRIKYVCGKLEYLKKELGVLGQYD